MFKLLMKCFLMLIFCSTLGCLPRSTCERNEAGVCAEDSGVDFEIFENILAIPEIHLVEIPENLGITHLSFNAEIFALPANHSTPSLSTSVYFTYMVPGGYPSSEAISEIRLFDMPFHLQSNLHYIISLRIQTDFDDGISICIAGNVNGDSPYHICSRLSVRNIYPFSYFQNGVLVIFLDVQQLLELSGIQRQIHGF